MQGEWRRWSKQQQSCEGESEGEGENGSQLGKTEWEWMGLRDLGLEKLVFILGFFFFFFLNFFNIIYTGRVQAEYAYTETQLEPASGF